MSSTSTRLNRRLWTIAALLAEGLLYGYALIPLGLRLPCPFRLLTGLRCPGCGVTDLCLGLLHGRFVPAYNWGLTLAAPGLLWLLFAGKRHPKAARTLVWVLLAALLAWGVLRNFRGI